MSTFKMDYFRTYYFTNICDSVIEDTFPYVTTLNDFWGDGKFAYFLKPFQKYSVLHQYIDFCIDRLIYEANKGLGELSIEQLKTKEFWINEALNYHKIEHETFSDWLVSANDTHNHPEDLLSEYFFDIEMSDAFSMLKYQMVEEAFYVLFLNRKFLQAFNLEMAEMFNVEHIEDFNEESIYLKKNETLKRTRIPKWAERAVFYRDRGKCTACNKDLTGLFNISNKYHIDHIIPLSANGLNDVSNLQLLCETCNTSKGGKIWATSTNYEKWY
ncbi:HNH endonuclease signature motif containing protein [Labilibaculum manganireducens]|uniref:HNH endonuclease n=1 Tax=Labilibaculum manganireducens TaxID=1940525 RepID=UPI0029F4E28C|nr:HNH endonuclease signature motif containing protein [Labilibaculum manganireducens]